MLKKVYSLIEKADAVWRPNRSCGPANFSRSGPESEAVDRIILLTLDTLRADHLGCYGYPRKISPFLDGAAENGIRFEHAYTSMSTTVPAHTSILTSLHPIQHNVLKNGHRLDDRFVTIAQSLKAQGFQTAAFVSTDRHFSPGNLHRGFDVFDEPAPHRVQVYRRAKRTVDKTIRWLNERKPDERFFLWVHLFDPHAPFKTPPASCDVLARETPDQKQQFTQYLLERQQVNLDFYDGDPAAMHKIIDAYDAEIAYMDGHIHRLFQHCRQRDINSRALWIFTGDHGEGLGNHRWMGHGKNLYQEQANIPLTFHFTSRDLAGQRVKQVVEHVDIFPTVMDLIGGGIDNQALPVQGGSLAPLCLAKPGAVEKEVAFIQRRDYDPKNRPATVDPLQDNYEDGEKYALVDGRHKYILRTQGADEFYSLAEDPYESENLCGRGLPQEKTLKEQLAYKVDRFKQSIDVAPASVDDVTIERLKDLGYVQ